MMAMPVIAVQPDGEFGSAFLGGVVSAGVGPFAQAGLDEALGVAVDFGGVNIRFRAQMLDFEPAQRLGVAPDRKLEPLSVMTRSTLTPKPRKKRRALNRKRKQDAGFSSGGSPRGARGRRSPDAQFPADPTGVALTGAIARDPMANPTELAQLFDVDVEDLSGAARDVWDRPARAPTTGGSQRA
jgi:hypothetical protein